MGRRVVPFVIGNMFKQVLDEEDLSIGRKNELLDMLYEKDIVSDPEFRMYLSMTYDRVRELTEDEVNKKVDNVSNLNYRDRLTAVNVEMLGRVLEEKGFSDEEIDDYFRILYSKGYNGDNVQLEDYFAEACRRVASKLGVFGEPRK